jgi:predicted dienelactone hydrolase
MRLQIILLCLLLSPLVADAAEALYPGAGLRKIQVLDPVGGASMNAVAFYPAAARTQAIAIGPFEVEAAKSVPIAGDRYPLVMLSHGSLGSMWGHHDLATDLARQGYVVVSVTHPGDNFEDAGRVGTTAALYGRPVQISAALTAALRDPVLAAHVDPAKVGFLGFSAGGATGLLLAGGTPDLTRLQTYCADQPGRPAVCEAGGIIRADPLAPALATAVPPAPAADDRIRSLVLMAPLSVLFPPDSLAGIDRPILVFAGDRDEELSLDANARALVRDMPGRAALTVLPEVGHATFLAPCTAGLQEAMPALCVDRPGIDRAGLHRRMARDIAAFFARTLAGPSAPTAR